MTLAVKPSHLDPPTLPLPLQVRRLERQRGVRLSPTELLANSLGRLAAGVQQLEQGLASASPAAAADGPPDMVPATPADLSPAAPAAATAEDSGRGSAASGSVAAAAARGSSGAAAPGDNGASGHTSSSADARGGGANLPAMALFAGRRSSSRRFLLLQNW